VTDASSSWWSDQQLLRGAQYATDRNLAARQSIYAYQEPKLELPAAVLDALDLAGAETVADVGCGNGRYLAELGRRGHQGSLVGIDASPGMLAAARGKSPGAGLAVGDAATLPLRAGAVDLTLAMHMLYHLTDPAAALTELRRVTKPGGRIVLGLNGTEHLHELRTIVNAVLLEHGRDERMAGERISLDAGAELAAGCFDSVVRLDFVGELKLPEPGPVARYVRSMSVNLGHDDDDEVVADVVSRLAFGADGYYRIRTHTGCLICSASPTR
jgi:SAM-dependent methyltransferase